MPRFHVSFPHTGWDGRRRQPGEVVEIGDHEARTRVRDGFGRILENLPDELPAQTEPEPKVPNRASSKAEWIGYLTGQGHDATELDGMTREGIIATYAPKR